MRQFSLSILIATVMLLAFSPTDCWAARIDINPPAENIEKFFNAFNRDTMYLVEDFYDPQIKFYDPLVTIEGRDELRRYYEGMYEGVEWVRFHFKDEVSDGDQHVVFWTMVLKTKKMNGGKPISVEGNSHIRFGGADGKAVYHRDYFDVGEMVYEHVPVVGWLTGHVKKKLKKHAEPKGK